MEWILLAVVAGVLVFAVNVILTAAKDEKRDAAEKVQSQVDLGNRIDRLAEEALRHLESLPHHLNSAERNLDQAEREFADGAFAPFWDYIEKSTEALGRFDHGVRELKLAAAQYRDLISRYDNEPRHFPITRSSAEKLGVAEGTAQRMQNVVRLAQRDFHFATIYEQRKTNHILVAGFTNLADALREMTWRVSESVSGLAGSLENTARTIGTSVGSLDSRVGSLVEVTTNHAERASRAASEAALREEAALAMLDNVQRGRQPWP